MAIKYTDVNHRGHSDKLILIFLQAYSFLKQQEI